MLGICAPAASYTGSIDMIDDRTLLDQKAVAYSLPLIEKSFTFVVVSPIN